MSKNESMLFISNTLLMPVKFYHYFNCLFNKVLISLGLGSFTFNSFCLYIY